MCENTGARKRLLYMLLEEDMVERAKDMFMNPLSVCLAWIHVERKRAEEP